MSSPTLSPILTPAVYPQATQFLRQVDNDWAQLIDSVGACKLADEIEPALSPYQALVQSVAYQQLHAKAAAAIFARFLALFGGEFPQPQQLLDAPFDALRECGFSARKIDTIKGIALQASIGQVPSLAEAASISDNELIQQLIPIKGIGRWTVEMMLIFTLARADVLAVDDFAIVAGYTRLKKLNSPPKPKQMAEIAQAWAPYRSIASWYLWRVPKT